MSELGETFAALREHNREKKIENHASSIALLDKHGVQYETLTEHHLRIGEFDFWPSTGMYIQRKTKRRGRGIFGLLRRLGVETA